MVPRERSWSGPRLVEVSRVENSLWTMQGIKTGLLIITDGIGFPVASAEGGIVEFVEELYLRFRLFDDNTQICLQGDSLMDEMTI